MKKTRPVISFFIALLLLLSTCAPAGAAMDALTVAIVASADLELYPLAIRERDPVNILNMVYEGMVSLDDSEMPVPCLAESWTVSNSGRRWTFHLRSGVTFHNGKPLTAHDVVATLDAIKLLAGYDNENKTSVPVAERGLYYNIIAYASEWQAVDDLTVQITANRAYYGLLNAMTFPVLPADEVDLPQPSGTGPYKIEMYEPGERLWITANYSWWKVPTRVMNIIAYIYEDTQAALDAFEYDQVGAAMTRSLSATRYSGSSRTFSLPYSTRQLEVLLIDHAIAPLDNVNVRRAIQSAIDVDSIIKQIYQSMATPVNTTVRSGTWVYDETAVRYGYNPAMARALLEQEGWLLEEGATVRTKTVGGEKKSLHFRLFTYEEPGSSLRRNAAASIQEMLAAVGISTTITSSSYSAVRQSLTAGNFDLVLGAYQMDVVPDPGFSIYSGQSTNYCRYRSSDMTDLIKALRTQYEAEGYRQAMSDIQHKFAEDVPYVTLYYRTGALLSRETFTNVRDIREFELLRGIEELP